MAMTVGELVVKLGIKADIFSLKEFKSVMEDTALSSAMTIASIAGMSLAFGDLLMHTFDTATGFKLFTDQTEMSQRELQKWQLVAKQVNVSTEAVESSFRGLQSAASAIKMGGGNIQPFARFRISPYEKEEKILQQLRKRVFDVQDAGLRRQLLAQMGVNESMMSIFRLSDDEFKKMSNMFTGITRENEKVILDFKKSQVEYFMWLRDLFYDLTVWSIKFLGKYNPFALFDKSGIGDAVGDLKDLIIGEISYEAYKNPIKDYGSFPSNISNKNATQNITMNISSNAPLRETFDDVDYLLGKASRHADVMINNGN